MLWADEAPCFTGEIMVIYTQWGHCNREWLNQELEPIKLVSVRA